MKPTRKLQLPISMAESECSPNFKKRTDSLIFSITSRKNGSPRETNLLLDSKEEEVSKQLRTLQMKLENLENKVQSIATEDYHQNHFNSSFHLSDDIDVGPFQEKNKQNLSYNVEQQIGKIMRKNHHRPIIENQPKHLVNQEHQKIRKSFLNTKRASQQKKHTFDDSVQSKRTEMSQSQLLQREKQISKLKNQLGKMKISVQKIQRSKSFCSEKLSTSKGEIKKLKKSSHQLEKEMIKLKNDLKKSQTIREKQKLIILKQRVEMDLLKNQLLFQNKNLR